MTEKIRYAVIEHVATVLPVDDALAVFRLLCGGTSVSYSWSDKGYKRSGEVPTLKPFSVGQLAQLDLES